MAESEGDKKKEVYKRLITSYFEKTTPGDYSFSTTLRHSIESIIMRLFEIIVLYFDKYDEPTFHTRMGPGYGLMDRKTGRVFPCAGFDFVGDWKRHHGTKFKAFVVTIGLNRLWFRFREDKIYEVITALLDEKGWVLEEHERLCIRQCVKRLYNILYHHNDTLADLKQGEQSL